MLYYKVNRLLNEMIEATDMDRRLVTSSPKSDKQLIDTNGIRMCLRAIAKNIEDVEKVLKE